MTASCYKLRIWTRLACREYRIPSRRPSPVLQRRILCGPRSLVTVSSKDSVVLQESKDYDTLLHAADEADRLLLSAKVEIVIPKEQSLPTAATIAEGTSTTPTHQHVASAALDLLTLSRDPFLQRIIETGSTIHTKKIAVIHRAFLSMTTKCLDCNDALLLDYAVQLTQRARLLGLPFHLPLYQQLLECAAAVLPERVLDAFELVPSTKTPMDSGVFRPALLSLIRNGRLIETIQLLESLTAEEKMTWDQQVIEEIYKELHDVTKTRYQADGCEHVDEDSTAKIVSLLEPAFMQMSSQNNIVKDSMEKFVNAISENDVNAFLDEIKRNETRVSKQADDDSENDDSDYDDSGSETRKMADTWDALVHTILLRDVESSSTFYSFAQLVPVLLAESHATIPRLVNITTDNANDLYSDLESDWDESDSDFEARNNNRSQETRFPDITSELASLNKRGVVQFTGKYQKIVWLRDSDYDTDENSDEENASLDYNDDSDDDDDGY